jgi:two-component system, LuxR family, response regulator DctR
MNAPRVHIIDDDPAICDALKWLFKSRGLPATTWPSATAFLDTPWQELEGCLIVDIRMPGISGLELFERLRKLGCSLQIIFLTGHGDVPMAVDALKKGARDFIEKPFNDNDLVDRVIAALDAEARERKHVCIRVNIETRLATLSAREREVMNLLLVGKMNKVIADELGITMRTVEVHRARIFEKMGVRSAVELANLLASLRS